MKIKIFKYGFICFYYVRFYYCEVFCRIKKGVDEFIFSLVFWVREWLEVDLSSYFELSVWNLVGYCFSISFFFFRVFEVCFVFLVIIFIKVVEGRRFLSLVLEIVVRFYGMFWNISIVECDGFYFLVILFFEELLWWYLKCIVFCFV